MVSFSVSAVDPAVSREAPVVVDKAEVEAVERPIVRKGPISVAGGQNYAYSREARISTNPSFETSASSGQAAGRISQGGGFQPAQNGGGRYLSRNGVQWQGAWENNNPAGNIRRGEEYLRYLRSEFKGDASRSLTTRKFGIGSTGKSVSLPPAKDLPAMRYSK